MWVADRGGMEPTKPKPRLGWPLIIIVVGSIAWMAYTVWSVWGTGKRWTYSDEVAPGVWVTKPMDGGP